MNIDHLATGATAKMLGLMPDEGFWLAVTLIALAIVLDLLLVKSVLDRRILEKKPIVGATIVLAAISFLCFVGGMLLLLV